MPKFLTEEIAFFHRISPLIIDLVAINFTTKHTFSYQKDDRERLNVATEIDKKVETFIIDNLRKAFIGDRIFSEETYSHEKDLNQGRVWIIDPICGTINFSRGIKSFTTNIALALDGKVIAGCIIDHSRGEYIWSTGGKKIYVNDKLFYEKEKETTNVLVEVNLGGLPYWDSTIRKTYARFLSRLITKTNYNVVSHATALSFVYVALGRVDAYVSPFEHLWDLPAINFLIEQASGFVTELSGKPWQLTSTNTVGAKDSNLHKKLLILLNE